MRHAHVRYAWLNGRKDMQRLKGLAPVEAPDARLLILGSMPGVASLAAGQYYAYAHNHFWQLVFSMLGEADPTAYEARIELLRKRKIALWDVIQSCERTGSLDKDIRNAVPNDIPAFLHAHPFIKTVCFNGITAQRTYQKHFQQLDDLQYILLPSSSPVPRRRIRTFTDKLPEWRVLKEYI